MESPLRARIAALVAADPALADDLALRGALIEILDRGEPAVPELRLPADIVRARLAAGVPLLDRLDLPIPASIVSLLDRLTVALLAAPDTRAPAETLLRALRDHRLHAEQLVGEAVVGHDDHLATLAGAAGVMDRLVITVADLAARSFLAVVADRLRPALSLGSWDHAYCPICGGLPLLAEYVLPGDSFSPSSSVGGGTSGRGPANIVLRTTSQSMFAPRSGWGVGLSLRCGRCASAWAHSLQGCPNCTSGAFSVIDLDEELGGWQIAVCNACPEYLKLAPSPRSERLADLLVDDLETWHLDRWALTEGLQRRGGPGYRLEHGEPAGEELDDD